LKCVSDANIAKVTCAGKTGSTCEIGRGIIDIPKFLKEVVRLKYSGVLALEFEKDADDPLPGMAKSIGYVKGFLAGLV
jgi:sugar phosphate isomerase/epimerase